MPDIFDEVQDDLRAERMRRLLTRYGGLLILVALGVVVAVAGTEAWNWRQGKQATKLAAKYLDAAHAADLPSAASQAQAAPLLDDLIAKGSPGYRTLARLRQAGLLAATDPAGAGALWDSVARDEAADPLLRDLARLQWALHNVDAGDPSAVAERLRPLTAQTSPWHGLATEAQAMLDLRLGHTDAARDSLRLLVQDTGAPQGVRRRAGGLLEQLGPGTAKAAS